MTADSSPQPRHQNIRAAVRSVLAETQATWTSRTDSWMRGHDDELSHALARAGLIGMTWPARYGGGEASALERVVMTEELLRVGAPVAAHWMGDRQIGQSILRYGSTRLKEEFLPRIARGEITFCLGMSEPDAGSDLAAVRTRAVEAKGGYVITGRKIWTSHAHRSTHAYVLARTSDGDSKHQGLTEFIVDLSAPGVEVNPILDLMGEHHFNETVFDKVFVPEAHVIGSVGGGWRQVTEQLSYERGGMERVLSTYPLLSQTLDVGASSNEPVTLGKLLARLAGLRQLVQGIAGAVDRGEAPTHDAAVMKYLGTAFEGDVVEYFREALGRVPGSGDAQAQELALALAAMPAFTLRGGTSEVLLTLISRPILERSTAARAARRAPGNSEFAALVADVCERSAWSPLVELASPGWSEVSELGWLTLATAAAGGDLNDVLALAWALARAGCRAPVAVTAVANGVLAAAGRPVSDKQVVIPVTGEGLRLRATADGQLLSGTASGIAWGAQAGRYVVQAVDGTREILIDLQANAEGIEISAWTALSGEPRADIVFNDVPLPDDAVWTSSTDQFLGQLLLVGCAAMIGAADGTIESVRMHVTTREQFGRPLSAFQAVSHAVARMAAAVDLARAGVARAMSNPGDESLDDVLAARVLASSAATVVARTSHQLVGAIGTTREHPLHQTTLSLWTWRDDVISEADAARRLSHRAFDAGSDRFWGWLVRDLRSLDSPERHGGR